MTSPYQSLRLEELPETCWACGGSGSIELDYGSFVQIKRCEDCEGRGFVGDPDLAHSSAPLRNRVTRASPRADKSSRPSAGTALRGALQDVSGLFFVALLAGLVVMA